MARYNVKISTWVYGNKYMSSKMGRGGTKQNGSQIQIAACLIEARLSLYLSAKMFFWRWFLNFYRFTKAVKGVAMLKGEQIFRLPSLNYMLD